MSYNNSSSGLDPIEFRAVYAVYLSILLFGIFANIIAFCVLVCYYLYSSSIVAFVINMIAADFMLLIVAIYTKMEPLIFGRSSTSSCKLATSLDVALLHVSSYTIVLIACQRFIVIKYHRLADSLYRKYPRINSYLCSLIWLVAFLISTPMAVVTHEFHGFCVNSLSHVQDCILNTFLLLSSYILPGIVVTFPYVSMLNQIFRDNDSVMDPFSQKQLMKFLLGVIIAFWACHLPFWVFLLLSTYVSYNSPFLGASIVLTYLSSIINPFIYVLLSTAGRDFVRQRLFSLRAWKEMMCVPCDCIAVLLMLYPSEDFDTASDEGLYRGVGSRSTPSSGCKDQPGCSATPAQLNGGYRVSSGDVIQQMEVINEEAI